MTGEPASYGQEAGGKGTGVRLTEPVSYLQQRLVADVLANERQENLYPVADRNW